MPEEMLRRSTVTGIEIDPLTARIAKALYPDADIRAQPFEQIQTRRWILRPRHFQRAVWRLHRPRPALEQLQVSHPRLFLRRRAGKGASGRSADVHHVARHDGQAGFDACANCSPRARNCLGAIRLPNDAFKKNAGTEVTTDIVMLRKLRPGESPARPGVERNRRISPTTGGEVFHQRILCRPSGNDARSNAARRWNVWRQRTDAGTGRSRTWRRHWRRPSSDCRRTFTRSSHTRSPSQRSNESIPAPDFVKPNAYCLHDDGMVCIREENVLASADDCPARRARASGI